MEHNTESRISIQVSLSGFSFKVEDGENVSSSGWRGADRIFTTPEFQKRYDIVDISLLTPKCALFPKNFIDTDNTFAALADVADIRERDVVETVQIPEYNSVLVFSNSIGESLSKAISQSVIRTDGEKSPVLPEMYYIISDLKKCPDYNKIVASYADSHLYLAVAQGKSLLLCNVFDAVDFTTAEYFIFLVMKKLQLNPEQSTICFRTPVTGEQEMSLYRYFRTVESI